MNTSRRTDREISRTPRPERACRGIEELRRSALAAEEAFAAELDAVAPAMRECACNLVHYLAVRRHDVRVLQDDLARLGLSSLGRMEAHVMASLHAVQEVLHEVLARAVPPDVAAPAAIQFDTGHALLAEHANRILGPASAGRRTRIMVTMPGEAADNPGIIRGLVEAGMQVMRINCAHDGPEVWERMVRHLRKAERDTGRRCLLSCDLAGPKLRTGPIALGPEVLKWRPVRDATRPAFVSCALPEVFTGVRVGEPILFDDGKIRGIGRGVAEDRLSVEVGFERLSEVQEEVLWLCEAAHVPVIWAAQVLEPLAKGGDALARRGHGCRDGQPRRVRDAEQGPLHPRDPALPHRRARAHGGTPAQEDGAAAQAARVGRDADAGPAGKGGAAGLKRAARAAHRHRGVMEVRYKGSVANIPKVDCHGDTKVCSCKRKKGRGPQRGRAPSHGERGRLLHRPVPGLLRRRHDGGLAAGRATGRSPARRRRAAGVACRKRRGLAGALIL